MGESWPTSPVQTERSEVCTSDRGQDSPIQTDLARLIRCLLYGQTRKQGNKNINNFICFPAQAQAFSWLSSVTGLESKRDENNCSKSSFVHTLYNTKAEEGLPTSHFPLPTSDFQLPTSNFQLPTSDFQLPTSDFRLPTSVAMKGGDRPTRLLPYAKMLLVPKTFFSLLLGRLMKLHQLWRMHCDTADSSLVFF